MYTSGIRQKNPWAKAPYSCHFGHSPWNNQVYSGDIFRHTLALREIQEIIRGIFQTNLQKFQEIIWGNIQVCPGNTRKFHNTEDGGNY